MKVLLISANTETINLRPLPLGLARVAAAAAQAAHEVVLVNLMFEGDVRAALQDRIDEFRPDVIGVSVRNIDDQNMADPRFFLPAVREVVAECRRALPAPVIVGGAGYSIFPEGALRYLVADIGVQGEGESVFPALLERLAHGSSVDDLPGVYLPERVPARRSFLRNLDGLPLPEAAQWIPLPPAGCDLWVPVQTRRGCPLDCSYCSTPAIEGRSLRRHSPEVIVAWLARLARAGYRHFNFVDNTFNLPPYYAEALCRGIIDAALDIEWWCIIYPKWVDRALVGRMARAGCRQISLGFESGAGSILRSLNKRFSPAEVKAVSEMFREAGIERRGFLLLGAPGETRETVEESLAFADSLQLDYLKVTVGLRIYPHTALAETALAEGLIQAEDDLLFPRFYLAPALREWLPERVAAYQAARPWAV